MSGLPFWEVHQDIHVEQIDNVDEEEIKIVKKDVPYNKQPDNQEFRNRLAEQIVQKMTEEKKHKIQLITELDGL